MEPKGKVIIVTGASSGIGLAAARALARAGARVALAARSLDTLRAEADRLAAEGATVLAVPMDVTSDASVAAAVEAVLGRFGRIDAVVNNAGNAGRLSFWASTEPATSRAMFDVHVFGMERVTRAVLPHMLARGEGTIVNIASTLAWVPMPMAAAYSAAKAAVLSFSESLRGELAGRGVEVVLFAPPHTRTPSEMPLQGPRVFPPEWVADELVRALRRGRVCFLAGASNRALLLMRRIAPGVASRIMRDIGLRAGARALARA
jgi:NAD(P)-dependent dehydrogenase (short-subunit alcohol dehydrogenase family)